MPGRTREAGPGAWRVQGFGVSPGHAGRGRRGRGVGATWGAPGRNGETRRRHDDSIYRGHDRRGPAGDSGRGTRCGGGVVVEVDTALEPERGDLVACSTADDCPSAPQIARIRRVDAEAGMLEVQPLDTALEAATVARDAKPEDGLTVDGVIVAAYVPVYVRGRGGEHWLRA